MGGTPGPAECFVGLVPSLSMITLFTPSFADESDTNAQNLTVKEVVARLDADRFHVTMLSEGTVDPRIAERPNTRILRWQRHGNTIRTLAHLLRNVPDIYFFPREGPLDAGFLQLRRVLGLRTAVATYVVTGGQLESGSPRSTLARNIREAQAVAGNSRYLSRLLEERLGVAAETIYDGVDRRYFFPVEGSPAPRSDSRSVLFAGSLRPYKRPRIVVEQASLWPDVEFRIAGRGEEEPACRALSRELGCKNVTFLGHLTPQQLGEEMRSASVFFFPSVLEGHPQVLAQAAGCGLPAVAMNHYHPEYVVDGKTGFLAGSDAELSEGLARLLRDPELRSSMAYAAASQSKNFEWENATSAWAGVFERLMCSRKNHSQ
jgi:glycosyltransferase involved in cell wall biosynthesis